MSNAKPIEAMMQISVFWPKEMESVEGCDIQGSEVRGRRSEVGGQRSEVRGRRSEVGGQRSEVRGQRSEVGGQRSEVRGPFPQPSTLHPHPLHGSSLM